MKYLQAAFEAVIPDARTPEAWFVSLVEDVPYYGGPEEGGWWGSDRELVAFRQYATEEAARRAASSIESLARDLSNEARRAEGESCLRSLEWLEARGLDADFLPEPDGPSKFSVVVTEGEPAAASRGVRHYS